jgi:hypothetical protein
MKNNLLWWYRIFKKNGSPLKRWAKLENVTEHELEMIVELCKKLEAGEDKLRDMAYIDKALKETGLKPFELALQSGVEKSVLTNVKKGRRGLGAKNRELIFKFTGIEYKIPEIQYDLSEEKYT